jgi:diaminohydroxyphosphoribosylaminopyrimidine deaminase/5-amino-6-(5-phosphoribosylamino)uracil reductase
VNLKRGTQMFNADDRKFMKQALGLARKASGLASPNPTVGCVIVRNGGVLGRGWHEYDRKDHAEVRALGQASGSLRNATAYLTLEPCSHYGRTPPCADKLVEAGIGRVVVARMDPNPLVSGRGIERLRSAGIKVDVGLLSEEAGKLIEAFACRISTGLPLVVSKAGMSLDGKIGTGRPEGRWITSPESREFGQQLRLTADALLVGIGTILADDPDLTYRGPASKRRPLMKVVLDAQLRTPCAARIFQTSPNTPVLIFCRERASQAHRAELEKKGAEIVSVPGSDDELDLRAVLEELGRRDVLGVLVEGGSKTHWSFLSNKLVDKFYFIIAPIVLGGKDSVPSVGGKGYAAVEESPKFKISRCFSVGPDIVLETYPHYSRSIISPWLSPEKAPCRELNLRRSSGRK